MPGLNDLIELMNVFKNQTPSSPTWYQVIDQVVGTLLNIEIERAEQRARDEATPFGQGEVSLREAHGRIKFLERTLSDIGEYCSGDDRTLGAIERLVSIRNTAEYAVRNPASIKGSATT